MIKLKRKNFISGLSLLLISATGILLYFVYKKMKTVKLTKWMEDYIEEIQILIKNEKFTQLSLETISKIFHLQKEIADYFFENEFYEIEDKRLDAFNSPYSSMYDMYVSETVQAYNECLEKAKKLLEKSLSLKFKQIEKIKENSDQMRVHYVFKRYRKLYYTLPNINKTKLIECYINYAIYRKKTYYKDIEDMKKMKIFHHHSITAAMNIYRNKYKLKDEIKVAYNLDYKYLDQLVKYHNLTDIPKIRYFYEEMFNLQEYI